MTSVALYRTLELPGANPLKDAHAALDAAVLATFPWPQFDGVGRVTPCAPSGDSKRDASPRSSGARGATRPTIELPDAKNLVTEDCIRPV